MGRPTAWLLNFEADLEFACGGAYTPSRALAAQLVHLRRQHAERLLAPGDLLLEDPSVNSAQHEARAWCPTPGALAQIRAFGLEAPRAPALETLALCNSRGFCAGLGEPLPGGFFSDDEEALLDHMAQQEPQGGWILKRNYGTSGKGQLRYRRERRDVGLEAWLRASLQQGGVRVEPLLRIEQEFAIHGWIQESGDTQIGLPCAQTCGEHGTWTDTRAVLAHELRAGEAAALQESAQRVAFALVATGYYGPFGVDAYRWLDDAREGHLNPLSEINARFTLGWGIGFPATAGRPWWG
jgi:hypothetical protein